MPHLLSSPIAPTSSIPTSTANGGLTNTKLPLYSKKDEQEQQPRTTKDLRLPGRCDDDDESCNLVTMISPEQEVPSKRHWSSRVEWGRDDRELAAMQMMLELPHMPPSPAASEMAKERCNNYAHRKTNDPTLGSTTSTSCFKPQPRAFVPYLSTRGRGSRPVTQFYPTPNTSRNRPLPTTAPVLRPHAPPFSPHLYCREDTVPHSPFMTAQRRGMHVSQRGGGRGGIVITRERRYPRYDSTIPYHYDCEYYPHPPYYHAPPPSTAVPEPRNLSTIDLQDEIEQEHEQGPTSFDQDSIMEEAHGVEYESTAHQPEEGPVIFKELVSPGDEYHYQHYYPYSPYCTAYPQPPPYSRYPLRPAALFREARPPQPKPHSRHMPMRGIPASVVQFFPGPESAPQAAGNFSRSQPKKKSISSQQQLQLQRQHHQQQRPVIASLERCIPMNGLVPSKFWGDVDKVKDAYIPVFDQLVNFPDHLSKYQSSKPILTGGGGSSILSRHCVMCGIQCICTSSSEVSGPIVASVKDESSSADGSAPSYTIKGGESGGAIIPRQNKGICTKCDVMVWTIAESGLQIKWCKGCKNFRTWAAFGEKGGATKCTKCRERQREKYAAQKNRADVEPTKKRKVENSMEGEVNSTESSKKQHTTHEVIHDPKLTQTTEQREDKEHEDDESDQLQW